MKYTVRALVASSLFSLFDLAESSARTWIIQEDGSGDASTIQAGIDTSANGDTVRVMPGTYFENIDFKGKAIAVLGSGPATTIIDGSRGGPCVAFMSAEGRGSTLCDFTLTGGTGFGGISPTGGGIYIDGASPSIFSNWITDNRAVSTLGGTSGWGGGILCACPSGTASPVIQGNVISNNLAGLNGGGIGLDGYVGAIIRDNFISGNETIDGDGGGIYGLINADAGVIEGNVVVDNTSGDHGGGIYIANPGVQAFVNAQINGNIVISNRALWKSRVVSAGGGIWLGKIGASIYENTIAFNHGLDSDSTSAGGIGLDRSSASVVERNIIAFNQGGGIRCDDDGPATIRNNLVWMNQGGHGLGLCQGWESTDVERRDYSDLRRQEDSRTPLLT